MKRIVEQQTRRYKMYKSGKKWIFAAVVTTAIMSSTYLTVQAETTNPSVSNEMPVKDTSATDSSQQATTTTHSNLTNNEADTRNGQVVPVESQPQSDAVESQTGTSSETEQGVNAGESTKPDGTSSFASATQPTDTSNESLTVDSSQPAKPGATNQQPNDLEGANQQPSNQTVPQDKPATTTSDTDNQLQTINNMIVKLAVSDNQAMMTSVVPDPALQKAIADAYNQSFYPSLNKTIQEITVADMQAIKTLRIPSFGSTGYQVLPQTFEGIQYCTNLKTLFISSAGNTDVPSDIDFSAIAKITSLERLDFDVVPFTTDKLPDLSKLPSLKKLSIDQSAGGDFWAESSNRLDNSVFKLLEQCHGLTTLSIEGTNIDSLMGLVGVKMANPNLSTIIFSKNRIKDLSVLKQGLNLDNVTRIVVSQQQVSSEYTLNHNDFSYNPETQQLSLPFSKLKDLIINPDGTPSYPTRSTVVNYNGKWVNATLTNNAFVIDGVTQSDFDNLKVFKWKPDWFLSDDYKTDGIFNFGGNAIRQTINVEASLPGANVTVQYVDEAGHEIAPTETLTGKIGDPYTTQAKEIPGYTLKNVTGNTTGTFSENAQSVTYVYQKVVDQSSITGHDVTINVNDSMPDAAALGASATDQAGKSIPVTLDTSAVDLAKPGSYPVTITASNGLSKIVYVHVLAQQPVAGAEVTVQYLDENGHEIAPTETLTGKIGDPYTTQVKEIAGYILKKVTGNATGTFSEKVQSVIYVYQKVADQSNVTGHDVTIDVNSPLPNVNDLGASATDQNGKTIPITLDTSAVDVTTPGSYPVIIKAANGLTKTVYVHVVALAVPETPNDSDGNGSSDAITKTPGENLTKDNRSGFQNDLHGFIVDDKGTNFSQSQTKQTQSNRKLPATGQRQSSLFLLLVEVALGLALMVWAFLQVERRKRK
ncbi:MucBP domain-containing protein [Fructilactobacillus cliffordii]|uniref:MucBP domain-containing protein n=1 Tax=Fructilactobacillus cliffordii TaxID=2940299 RepID=UPI002092770B|nr:MucBP domain-containing protein [Fructilactobacillus cliffordii]USS85992.1 MucBP domain-containing protein [Fructilactobacillus cliffordii]